MKHGTSDRITAANIFSKFREMYKTQKKHGAENHLSSLQALILIFEISTN
jgi:hypothetical protein